MGVDIGSSTSHVMLARLVLQRLADALSSRYVVVERTVIARSPIVLTPIRDGLIDTQALEHLVEATYAAAGITRDDVDTGAVILTGVALERPNARAIDELFAAQGGRFVCATAGHRLEAILSAHGSGAVARSRARDNVVLAVDIGGGTTKLALCDRGRIVAASAIGVGARHVALPVERMADAVVDASCGRATGLELLPPIPAAPVPDEILFAGGVSEHLYGRDGESHGDQGLALAAAIRARSFPAPIVEGAEGIRATVVGASQFSVQLSGSTIFLSDAHVLPLRGVPVVRAPLEGLARAVAARDEREGPLALAIAWRGAPRHAQIRALGEAIRDAAAGRTPLVVALDLDVAHTLGRILVEELGHRGALVVIDGLDLRDLDYIDIGEVVRPAGVVPVVIKSLIFAS
ncbi:MAG TPA: ethanolamine ammonia-lyase reactivating factor EutA [Candidatus Limnocylindria bacterium]|nr:ethanolamine ammonia-lyase reactivating factor EutA [Candidatus Limnocylindria bacterium]